MSSLQSVGQARLIKDTWCTRPLHRTQLGHVLFERFQDLVRASLGSPVKLERLPTYFEYRHSWPHLSPNVPLFIALKRKTVRLFPGLEVLGFFFVLSAQLIDLFGRKVAVAHPRGSVVSHVQINRNRF